jgi:hypothetical protein
MLLKMFLMKIAYWKSKILYEEGFLVEWRKPMVLVSICFNSRWSCFSSKLSHFYYQRLRWKWKVFFQILVSAAKINGVWRHNILSKRKFDRKNLWLKLIESSFRRKSFLRPPLSIFLAAISIFCLNANSSA